MCGASYATAPLKNASSAFTSVTVPSAASLNPSGWFIHEFAATTDHAPPSPASTTGTPVQKCTHPDRCFQP